MAIKSQTRTAWAQRNRERAYAYRRSLNDGDCLDNLFLVHLRTRSIKVADNGGHPGLVSHGSGKMDWFLGVILRKAG
jgi:hypothetical protein